MIKIFIAGFVFGALFGAMAITAWALSQASSQRDNYDSDLLEKKAADNYKNLQKGGTNSDNKTQKPEDYEG